MTLKSTLDVSPWAVTPRAMTNVYCSSWAIQSLSMVMSVYHWSTVPSASIQSTRTVVSPTSSTCSILT